MSSSDARRAIRFIVGYSTTVLAGGLLVGWLVVSSDIINSRLAPAEGGRILPQTMHDAERMSALWFLNTATASLAPAWIVGTSISARGFDTCSVEGVENFSRPGQTLSDASTWLPAALLANPAVRTLFLELSTERTAPHPEAAVPLRSGRLVDNLSMELVAKSVEVSLDALGRDEESRCHLGTFEGERTFEARLPSAATEDLPRTVETLLRAVQPWCAGSRRHHIVFFLTPWFHGTTTSRDVAARRARFDEEAERAAARLATVHSGCRISLYRMQEPDGSTREEWLDYRHFHPSLGNEMLRKMISATGGVASGP